MKRRVLLLLSPLLSLFFFLFFSFFFSHFRVKSPGAKKLPVCGTMLVGLGRVDLIKNKIYFRIFFSVTIMLTTTSIIIMLLGNDTGTLLLPRRRSTNRGLIIFT